MFSEVLALHSKERRLKAGPCSLGMAAELRVSKSHMPLAPARGRTWSHSEGRAALCTSKKQHGDTLPIGKRSCCQNLQERALHVCKQQEEIEKENVGLLSNRNAELVTNNTGKAEVLNTFFSPVFTAGTSEQKSRLRHTQTHSRWRRSRSVNNYRSLASAHRWLWQHPPEGVQRTGWCHGWGDCNRWEVMRVEGHPRRLEDG